MRKSLHKIAVIALTVIIFATSVVGQAPLCVFAKENTQDMEDLEKKLEDALKGLDNLENIDGVIDGTTDDETNSSDTVSTIETAMMIASGDGFTLGLRTDGTVVSTGMSIYGADQVSDWTNITMISCGFSHSVGLKADGTVIAVGSDGSEECDVENWKDIKMIAAGVNYTVGLKKNGTVVATGTDDDNGKSDLTSWKDIKAIATGLHFTVGLKSDGTVLAAGKDCMGIIEVSDWKDIVAIAAASDNIYGLKKDGTIVSTIRSNTSVLKDAISIASSTGYAAGLKPDGTVVTNATSVDTSTWKDIIAISASTTHLVGLKKDGTVVATVTNGSWDTGQCDVTGWKLKVSKDIKATSANSKIVVNGTKSTIHTYTINKSIYVKMNDLAYVLKDTNKKFSISGDGVKKDMKLTLNSEYKSTGAEMTKGDTKTKAAQKNSLKIYVNGKKVKIMTYKINGEVYFKLNDMMKEFNISVKSSEKGTITINTKKSYN